MADHRRLATRLRREARAERPAFSAALHDRVLAASAAAAARRATRPADRRRPPGSPAAIRGLAVATACACAALAIGGWWWPAPRTGGADSVAAVADVPGIERLPTPAEIGEGVLAEATTLAADAVGLPAWTDLAALDPATFLPADTLQAVRAAD